ncbi:hypothetical protein Goshw_009392 [Gossypium schwendimanii]|uniref:Phytocyanin domain-containing protein n=2 Tax=Gossypium TaxID=3633 RepID=A0A7J9LLN0_GOSSC|nr:hypothetical protein [Gossypium aridum]MBA0859660.1 hypothetical protein [Gossypium schwendimanii]
MAIHRSLVIFAIVALKTPAISLATDFVVGDDDGWKLGIKYEDWAKGKQFFVGDTLVFKYNATVHNVYKVKGDNFKSCTVPSTIAWAHSLEMIQLSWQPPAINGTFAASTAIVMVG